MNKKGFTLVELLAAIIILSLLALLASTSVTNVVKNSKSDLYDSQIALIKSAAELWGADNINKLPNAGECKYLTLRDLKSSGSLNSSIINPKTNEEFDDGMIIKINSEETKYGSLNITYEVEPDNINNCKEVYKTICSAVTSDTKTTGNIPNGNYTAGDEYICTVNAYKKYHFFILSTEGEKVNLILDRNVYYNSDTDNGLTDENNLGNVAWNSTIDGPVTAMNYLHNATKSWTNIPNIDINYKDSNDVEGFGYNGIKTTDNITKIIKLDGTIANGTGYENLKARLPYMSEVSSFSGGVTQTNLWVYNYLGNSNSLDGSQTISGIFGYWTSATDGTNVCLVSTTGAINCFVDALSSTNYGVRPVISIYEYNLK